VSTVNTDLHAILLAAVEQRLKATRRQLYWAQQTSLALADPKLLGAYIPGWHDWPEVEELCEFAIRQVEADLRRLERHAPFEADAWWRSEKGVFCQHCQLTSNDGDPLSRAWPCDDLLDLAASYGVETEGDTRG
jgi:hypothetical protein